ncbi:MAG: putative creatinine amidohydrolase [Paenibacillus sp.]|nr:putative creatinine amidohydrolase [Paenibacillus sp.]
MLTYLNNKTAFQRQDTTVAVLPIGALEQHGSHLPVGTDTIIACELAARLARRLDAYLLPALPITCSIEHRKTKGTVYIKAATLASLIRDITESLQYSGFRKLYVVHGHDGNWIVKPTIRELNREFADIDVMLITMHEARERMLETGDHPVSPDIHAGETETSIMLHLHPDLVGEVHAADQRQFPPQGDLDYFDMAELTADGYWGSPELATADKGQRWLDLLEEAALQRIRHIDESRERIEKRQFSN